MVCLIMGISCIPMIGKDTSGGMIAAVMRGITRSWFRHCGFGMHSEDRQEDVFLLAEKLSDMRLRWMCIILAGIRGWGHAIM